MYSHPNMLSSNTSISWIKCLDYSYGVINVNNGGFSIDLSTAETVRQSRCENQATYDR